MKRLLHLVAVLLAVCALLPLGLAVYLVLPQDRTYEETSRQLERLAGSTTDPEVQTTIAILQEASAVSGRSAAATRLLVEPFLVGLAGLLLLVNAVVIVALAEVADGGHRTRKGKWHEQTTACHS